MPRRSSHAPPRLLIALLTTLLAGSAPGCTTRSGSDAPAPAGDVSDPTPRQPTPGAVDVRPGIAVLPFASGISIGSDRENLDALSVGLQQILITELAQNPALRVVERSAIRQLLEEQDLGASDRVDPATAARLGRIVGARYVVVGGFNDVEGRFRLDGRIVDVETSEILRAEQVTDGRDRLYGIVVELARRVTRGVDLPPLSADARRERERRSAALPPDAVILYSQAQYFEDQGEVGRARELYLRITTEFPALTEAAEALRRL